MKQPFAMLLALSRRHCSRPCLPAGPRWVPILATLLISGSLASQLPAQSTPRPSDESIALYADAANFQNGGALDLAINAWNKFLAEYPDHPMAADAAHFLGVCHMQSDPPKYAKASQSFARALKTKKYDFREESLVNYGWCLYASAGDGAKKDADLLKKTLTAYKELTEAFPESKFLDRAYFYSGEAAYGLGRIEDAIGFYNRLLKMRDAAKSPLHCQTLYARGVAFEELKRPDQALASYQQLLASCKRSELLGDVQLRIGNLLILQGKFQEAATALKQLPANVSDDDRAYALLRRAYALVQSDQPKEAAQTYDELLQQFPNSPYAASAVLASAQSSYRGGDMQTAEQKFRKVLSQKNPPAATEAAHWLARIYLSRGEAKQAIDITRGQIERGVEGDFANEVRLDLAEALAAEPSSVPESLKLFEKIYRDAPEDRLAPRALYNAAFSALQLGEPEKALALSLEFIKKFPRDTLASELRFVAAESQLATGQAELAANTYKFLLSSTDRDNIQRPMWVLRAAVASNAAEQWNQTVNLIRDELDNLTGSSQKAEAFQIVGQAHLQSDRPTDAILAFRKSLQADPNWPQRTQTTLLLGQAQLAANQLDDAERTWQRAISDASDPVMANQARYRIAQQAAADNRFEEAIKYYDQILGRSDNDRMTPFAQYGKGWAHLQLKQYDAAFKALDQMLKANAEHPLRGDATLARGITSRNLGKLESAERDLKEFLSSKPTDINLGHCLYELALVDQQKKKPENAAKLLERLVREVPDYPSMDQVLYELGWSLQESGDVRQATKYFEKLIKEYPDNDLIAESAYFVGQQNYAAKQWKAATGYFSIASESPSDTSLNEKAFYRLGWSHFNLGEYEESEKAFANQSSKHPNGSFAFDALMMVGESRFKRTDYPSALKAYEQARDWVRKKNDRSQSIRDDSERKIRELAFLHGGQSAAQLKEWDRAIEWYDELRERFPTTAYLPQVFYETGFAYQQKGDTENALKFFGEVANKYRNELAARARFMMGEIHFANQDLDKAIPEFQRVMYGFNAEKAPDRIKNWQAKSGFEAARCSELIMQKAKTTTSRAKSSKLARDFYRYVIEKHPGHELAGNSRQLLEALEK